MSAIEGLWLFGIMDEIKLVAFSPCFNSISISALLLAYPHRVLSPITFFGFLDDCISGITKAVGGGLYTEVMATPLSSAVRTSMLPQSLFDVESMIVPFWLA